MRLPRFSIAGFMAFVVFLGVTFAGMLRPATPAASEAMFTLAIATGGAALMGAMFTRGAAKVSWVGYLVFGSGFLFLCAGPWCEQHVMPFLAISPLIDERYAKMEYTPKKVGETVWVQDASLRFSSKGRVFGEIDQEYPVFNVERENGGTSHYEPDQLRALSPDSFRRLCHSTISLWTGFLGALISRLFFGRGNDQSGNGTKDDST